MLDFLRRTLSPDPVDGGTLNEPTEPSEPQEPSEPTEPQEPTEPKAEEFLIDDPDNDIRVRDAAAAHKIIRDQNAYIRQLKKQSREPAPVKPEPAAPPTPPDELDDLESDMKDLQEKRGELSEAEYWHRMDAIHAKQIAAMRKIAQRSEEVVTQKLAEKEQVSTWQSAENQRETELRDLATALPNEFYFPPNVEQWNRILESPSDPQYSKVTRMTEMLNEARQTGLSIEKVLALHDLDLAVAYKTAKKAPLKKEPTKPEPRRSATVLSAPDKVTTPKKSAAEVEDEIAKDWEELRL